MYIMMRDPGLIGVKPSNLLSNEAMQCAYIIDLMYVLFIVLAIAIGLIARGACA